MSDIELDSDQPGYSSPPPLQIGMSFANREDIKHYLRDYCCAYNTHYTVPNSNALRLEAICGNKFNVDSGCHWFANFRSREEGKTGKTWVLIDCKDLHICSGCAIPSRSSQHDKMWITKKASQQ